MKHYRPLLLQNIDLSLNGLRIRRLRLNRQAPEAQWVEHRHEFTQALVYLSGKGRQTVGGTIHPARPGTIILVPPGTPHAFDRRLNRPPLCLVIDLDLPERRGSPLVHAQLTQNDLTRLRARVSSLFRLQRIEDHEMSLRVGGIVLAIMDTVLRACGWLKPINRFGSGSRMTMTHRAERVIAANDSTDMSLKELADAIGFQRDHLNRVLREECGLTLGQLRARHRLSKAQDLLRRRQPVRTVALQSGFADHNYFSRWFRQQTGLTPTAWRRNPREVKG